MRFVLLCRLFHFFNSFFSIGCRQTEGETSFINLKAKSAELVIVRLLTALRILLGELLESALQACVVGVDGDFLAFLVEENLRYLHFFGYSHNLAYKSFLGSEAVFSGNFAPLLSRSFAEIPNRTRPTRPMARTRRYNWQQRLFIGSTRGFVGCAYPWLFGVFFLRPYPSISQI